MVNKRLQDKAEKLLKKVVDKLDLVNDGYCVNVSGRLKVNKANAQVWKWLHNRDIRRIDISKKLLKKYSNTDIIGTLIHEISHFKQMEEMLIEVGDDDDILRLADSIDAYRKARSVSSRNNTSYPHWHNKDFYRIYDRLNKLYKCRTGKAKGLKVRNE